MKKKVLAMVLAAMMACTGLAACGSDAKDGDAKSGKSASGEVTELEFWGWWSSDARKPYIEEMVEGFNESQDKYHVTYVDTPFGDIFTKNIAQIAAGKPCDIMANSMEEVKFRAQEGQVESLDEFLEDETKNAFYEQYMDACTGDDGETYALPLSVDTRVIYYNKAHFEEAGINAEEIVTWDDLAAAARKLDKKNGDDWERVGIEPVLGNGGVDTWLVNANQGPCWYDREAETPIVNSETNKEAYQWIREQMDVYGQDKYNELKAAWQSGMGDPFASGMVSMVVHTSGYVSNLQQSAPDLEYGVIKMPEFKEGQGHVTTGGGFVLEIPKGAKCPEGSYEFIKYVTSRETQDFLSTKLGDFSARNDFDDTSEFYKKPLVKEISSVLDETVLTLTPNRIKGYQDVVNPLIEEGTLGTKSTDEALDNAQKAFEDFLSNK